MRDTTQLVLRHSPTVLIMFIEPGLLFFYLTGLQGMGTMILLDMV